MLDRNEHGGPLGFGNRCSQANTNTKFVETSARGTAGLPELLVLTDTDPSGPLVFRILLVTDRRGVVGGAGGRAAGRASGRAGRESDRLGTVTDRRKEGRVGDEDNPTVVTTTTKTARRFTAAGDRCR